MKTLRRIMVGAAIVVSVAAGGALAVPAVAAQTAADPCGPPDRSVPWDYPVSGYWVFPRTDGGDPCEWRDTVEAVHQRGGDTLIQFGSPLHPRGVDGAGQVLAEDGEPDPLFTGCVVHGDPCYLAARQALRAAHPGNDIDQLYTYYYPEPFSTELLSCPGTERRLTASGRIYYWLFLPADNPQATGCEFGRGASYHLVLVSATANDSLGELLTQADAYGMDVFAALPTAPRHPVRAWEPDLAHLKPLLAFTRRVLGVYAGRYGHHESWRGLYQTAELKLHANANPATRQLYRAQHTVVNALVPGKEILVSPYFDARIAERNGTPFGFSPASAARGFKEVARTGVDIIAPQDGRGTGKGALFWDYQRDDPVDPRLVPVEGVGDRMYGQAYLAPTTDYYRAAWQARGELAAQESIDVELWANVEAFEPTADEPCATFARGRTGKPRLDRGVTFVGRYATKLISFMWDGLYTCQAGRPASLADEIAADADRPILVQAFRWQYQGRDGMVVRGYQLQGADVYLVWYDRDWDIHDRHISVPQQGWYIPDVGDRRANLADGLEEVWVPFSSWHDLAPEFWIHIQVTNDTGKAASHRWSLRY